MDKVEEKLDKRKKLVVRAAESLEQSWIMPQEIKSASNKKATYHFLGQKEPVSTRDRRECRENPHALVSSQDPM